MQDEPIRTVDEILARYARGERHFVGVEIDVPDNDLASLVLDGADFSGCWFQASFRGASLRGTKFRHANLKCCDFTGADLTAADFTGAALEAADWLGATLTGTRFGHVDLYGARLSEANFLAMITN